jgi:hypothetical protein
MGASLAQKYNRIRINLATTYDQFQKPYRYKSAKNLKGRVETLQYLLNSEVSISRFGDGEMIMALLGQGIGFQNKSQELSRKLQHILIEKDDRVLVCLNNEFMRNVTAHWVLDFERSKKDYIAYESLNRINDIGIILRKKEHTFYNESYKILFGNKKPSLFGDATVFMLGLYYNEYRNEQIEEVKELFMNMLRGKHLLIACPESPLMEPSFRALEKKMRLAGANNIKVITIPENNCFAHYQQIKSEILKTTGFETLWIQAGPTATVMAHDLATKHGVLAYDIGSLNTTLQYLL